MIEFKQGPRVQWLDSSNLDPRCQHSIVISLLRGLAALEVLAAHLRGQLYPSLRSLPDPNLWYQALAFFTGFAHQAVVIFFLLSGWLVGGSLLNKLHEPRVMLSYAIDRLTRLWIVLIPAFLLTLLFGILTGTVDPTQADLSPANAYSFSTFFGNLFGLQDMVVPRYGGNFALWSLANETWYYVLFPLVLLPVVAKSPAARVAAVALTLTAAASLDADLMLYFAIWLLGVGASRVRIEAGPALRGTLLAILLAVSVYFRLTGSNDSLVRESFVQDLVFSIAFLAYLCSLQFTANMARASTRLTARAGALFSSFSFTLYVIHVPLLFLLRNVFAEQLGGTLAPDALADFGIYVAMLSAIALLAYLFHLPFEAQTYRVRSWIKRRIAPASLPDAQPLTQRSA